MRGRPDMNSTSYDNRLTRHEQDLLAGLVEKVGTEREAVGEALGWLLYERPDAWVHAAKAATRRRRVARVGQRGVYATGRKPP
jgi:hypothetical protein